MTHKGYASVLRPMHFHWFWLMERLTRAEHGHQRTEFTGSQNVWTISKPAYSCFPSAWSSSLGIPAIELGFPIRMNSLTPVGWLQLLFCLHWVSCSLKVDRLWPTEVLIVGDSTEKLVLQTAFCPTLRCKCILGVLQKYIAYLDYTCWCHFIGTTPLGTVSATHK